MMAILDNHSSKFNQHNCKIKPQKLIEKEVIKNVYGLDSDIPETIYNRIQDCINNGINVSAVLKVKIDSDNAYWVSNSFLPSKNVDQHFSIQTNYLTDECITCIQKLYVTLKKIEKNVNLYYASKYLESFLEEANLTFNELALVKK